MPHPSYDLYSCYAILVIPLQYEVKVGSDLPLVSVVTRRFRIAFQFAGDIIYLGGAVTR